MLSLAAPWWLLGALAIPLLAWLHRFRLEGRRLAVSALFPWHGLSEPGAPGKRQGEPDPVWRIRAAAVSMMFLALADPVWRIALSPLEIWIDDSFSLHATEPGGTRLEQSLDLLVKALEERPGGSVLARSLTNPGKSLSLTDMSSAERREQLRAWLRPHTGEPRPPAAIHMSNAEHWLVSDGASPVLASWLASAPVSRVHQLGEETENVALTLLSARPALAGDDDWLVLAGVTNVGRAAAERHLVLRPDDSPAERVRLELAPMHTEVFWIRVPRSVRLVEATLSPPDALPQDDRLVLPLPSRAGLHLDQRCGESLRAVLATHPGLTMRDDARDAELTVSCGHDLDAWSGAHLFVRASGHGVPVSGHLQWQPAAGDLTRLPLQPRDLRLSPVVEARGVPWLSTSEAVLLSADLDAGFIELFIDVESAGLVRQAYYPMLVNGLLERLAGRPLLEPEPTVRRSGESSRIAPSPLQVAERGQAIESLESRRSLSQWALGAAIALVGWDLAGILRRRRGY
jgi:hypothetical protein